jgi:hypothetical protein
VPLCCSEFLGTLPGVLQGCSGGQLLLTPVAAQVSTHVYFPTLWAAADLPYVRPGLRVRGAGRFVRELGCSIRAFLDAQLLRGIRRYVMNFVGTGETANPTGTKGILLLE